MAGRRRIVPRRRGEPLALYVALLALLASACGGASPSPDRRGSSGEVASIESSAVASAATATASETPTRVTVEYLTGGWNFHRESGGGESGIVVFEPDGTNSTGVVFTEDGWKLEERESLEEFRQSYPEIVEIEPDRFVGLLSGSHRVVFERIARR